MIAKRKRVKSPKKFSKLDVLMDKGNSWFDDMQTYCGFMPTKEFEATHKLDNNFRAQAIDESLNLVNLCVFAGVSKAGGEWHDAAPGKQHKINPVLLRIKP